MGYNVNANGTECVIDANKTLAPCGPGYYKDQADFKCKACKGGCKRCTNDKDCSQCEKGVKWQLETGKQCSYECDNACVDGQNGVFKCAKPTGQSTAPVIPTACVLGW